MEQREGWELVNKNMEAEVRELTIHDKADNIHHKSREVCDVCQDYSLTLKEYRFQCVEGHIIRRFFCDFCVKNNMAGQVNPPAFCVRCHGLGDTVDMFAVNPVSNKTLERQVFEAEAVVKKRDNGMVYIEVDVPMVAGIIADVVKVGFDEGERVKVIVKRVVD